MTRKHPYLLRYSFALEFVTDLSIRGFPHLNSDKVFFFFFFAAGVHILSIAIDQIASSISIHDFESHTYPFYCTILYNYKEKIIW